MLLYPACLLKLPSLGMVTPTNLSLSLSLSLSYTHTHTLVFGPFSPFVAVAGVVAVIFASLQMQILVGRLIGKLFGFDENEILEITELEEVREMDHICIKGLMGMATFTDDEAQIRHEFQTLAQLFETLKQKSLPSQFEITELSMGMSNDFKIAIECGSTLLRVGTAIFGDRDYN